MPDKDTPPAQRPIPEAALAYTPQEGQSNVPNLVEAEELIPVPLAPETETLVCPVCSCIVLNIDQHNDALHPTPGTNAPVIPAPPPRQGQVDVP